MDAPEYVLSNHLQIHFTELPKNRLRDVASVGDKLEPARRMLQREFAIDDVADIAGLSEEEIKAPENEPE